jgi:hypothetical protein
MRFSRQHIRLVGDWRLMIAKNPLITTKFIDNCQQLLDILSQSNE